MINMDQYPHIKAIHILKDDQLIFENSKSDSEQELYKVACIFKSFLSALTGVAIREGKLESIHSRIIDYYPQFNDTDANWNKLTVKHALSKTTGLIWPGPKERLPDRMSEVVQLKFKEAPGIKFEYKPDPQIIVYLLEDLYKKDIVDLMEEKIFCHLGNGEWQWDRDHIQEMKLSIGMLDALGKLYLNRGIINNTRIFNEDYFEESTKPYAEGGFPEMLPYGLGWWIGEHRGTKFLLAAGFGGQKLAIIPELKMVISILSTMDKPHPQNQKLIYTLIEENQL